MKSSTALRRGLGKVRRAWSSGHYQQALAEVDCFLADWPANPQLLTMRGNLNQLQEDGPPLTDAKTALERAVDLDEESPAALIELAHFLFAVEDDAKAAAKTFEKAVSLYKRLLKEALLGKAAALAELGRRPEALACLSEALMFQAKNGRSATDPAHEEILERLGTLSRPE